MSSRPNCKPVHIPNDLYKKLKIAAAFNDLALARYIEKLLRENVPNIQSLAEELENDSL